MISRKVEYLIYVAAKRQYRNLVSDYCSYMMRGNREYKGRIIFFTLSMWSTSMNHEVGLSVKIK